MQWAEAECFSLDKFCMHFLYWERCVLAPKGCKRKTCAAPPLHPPHCAYYKSLKSLLTVFRGIYWFQRLGVIFMGILVPLVGEEKEKAIPSSRATGICVFFVLLCVLHDGVNNGACSMQWLQDPQAASSHGQPQCRAGRTCSMSCGAVQVLACGSCVGWFMMALPQHWRLSFSGLESALRLRSLQHLTSLSSSGLFSHPALWLWGEGYQTFTCYWWYI